jgi:hypothetical protein
MYVNAGALREGGARNGGDNAEGPNPIPGIRPLFDTALSQKLPVVSEKF